MPKVEVEDDLGSHDNCRKEDKQKLVQIAYVEY